ncbi:MAG TPA: hypothetical protein VJ948_13155, partial [Acidimicrobiia bacterium]|nr:hypothetical protein [Acidimicrobiia bacterium]
MHRSFRSTLTISLLTTLVALSPAGLGLPSHTVAASGDGADEMFFYRDDGLFRYYDINPNGTIGSPILSGDNYTNGWSAITAVDLDGDGQSASPLPPSNGSSSSSIDLYVFAKSGFNSYTKSPSTADQAWMREHYEFMTVWSPYFDSRLSWFPKGIEYSDTMGLKDLDHPEWVLKDGTGDHLYLDFACSGGKCPQYAADVGNQAYRNWFIGELKGLIAKGYAGVYLDDVNMSWRISDGSNEVQPIDPRTGKTMTLEAWREYMADFVEQIRREVDGIIVHNPIWTADTPDFNDPRVARQLAAADW